MRPFVILVVLKDAVSQTAVTPGNQRSEKRCGTSVQHESFGGRVMDGSISKSNSYSISRQKQLVYARSHWEETVGTRTVDISSIIFTIAS